MKLETFSSKVKKIEIPTSMTLFNPSIIENNEGWTVLVRVIEQNINKKNRNGFFYSENWIVYLDKNLQVIKYIVIDDEEQIKNYQECKYGLEDGRIFEWNKEKWILFSGLNILENKFINTMCLAKLVDNKLENFKILRSPNSQNREKNWTPLVENNELFIIYNIDPLEIYKLKNDKLELYYKSTNKNFNYFVSGSSTAINYQDNYIFVSHHRKKINAFKKVYLKIFNREKYKRDKVIFYHQFHILNIYEKKIKSSERFIFQKEGIEFCAGIALKENTLMISYGIADQAAYILEVPIPDLFKNIKEMSFLRNNVKF